ncbi:AAA family ATPase [Thermophagus xiamenensis]|uniref:ATPase family associated with various cellular activities (AAA) n=1 Tax=Thermophagus xiamenensis TaxID=385682 RepID=A0A1I2F8M4_9BACT|nr:ATP-binding protein [Thermophagus xiamenensis]SFF01147.1 ATPase family associated with various cellular activities (AAA) [Thermophagus xiamenensis]
MATAEQIKSLIKSHFSEEPERFSTIALQLAAHEAKKGNTALAHSIRELIDLGLKKNGPKIFKFPQDLKWLVLPEKPEVSKNTLVVNPQLKKRINLIIQEYKQQAKLKAFGLSHRRKILLTGPPGTGKTMTAKVLAYELHLPLYIIQVDKLVTKFMGETSAKLRQIFDLIDKELGVYLFDEFDAIGGERSLDNDVGEMRRVLNAFLQFIELDSSDSLIVAGTNNPKLLDKALFRRFDDVLFYEYPNEEEVKTLILNTLGNFKPSKMAWNQILEKSKSLSHAEIVAACTDAIKKSILDNKQKTTSKVIVEMLGQRADAHK